MPPAPVRVEVFYFGQVQGVGFRYSAVTMAKEYEVTGYAKNLPDGRVEFVVEGEKEEVEDFLAGVRVRLADYIQDLERSNAVATGEFDAFIIRD